MSAEKDAATVDGEICKAIYQLITEKESSVFLLQPTSSSPGTDLLNRDFTKRGLHYKLRSRYTRRPEASEIPYFDGFVGSFETFFWQERVDPQAQHGDLTKNWIRLWKIHGSLSCS